ncbi:TetR/AcrR family transcriptional regulator [Roseobacter sp. WL0113]|uniref:TetR/AcrR family transcriptional regulator n=2 Tax=Roseobacter sinensis TaxID=2931391 RepID=A0ABT3BLR4_9RHOB|nr:TetR/AcrR family transcriptional regulator [Roseobacter sp. WL0113]
MQMKTEKRRRRRKDARPSELLDAALAEFAERGFGNATIDGIARRADVARATVYLYFADKDALFDALMRRRLTDPLEQLDSAFNSYDGDSETLLKMLFIKLYEDAGDEEAVTVLRVLAAEGNRFPHLVQLHHDRVMRVGMGYLQKIIARGVARGEFAAHAAETDMRVLIAPAIMTLFWRMVFSKVADIDQEKIIEGHLRVVLDGIRK